MTRMPAKYTKRVNVYRDHTKDDARYTDRVWQQAYYAARKTVNHDAAKAVADDAYASQKK